ncbi:unnamed protein product [Amoebophrya sp. A120]|nr:unnamed protein product [Amoebophrya sp. A120]|eukprot:GSA120T00004316001.1
MSVWTLRNCIHVSIVMVCMCGYLIGVCIVVDRLKLDFYYEETAVATAEFFRNGKYYKEKTDRVAMKLLQRELPMGAEAGKDSTSGDGRTQGEHAASASPSDDAGRLLLRDHQKKSTRLLTVNSVTGMIDEDAAAENKAAPADTLMTSRTRTGTSVAKIGVPVDRDRAESRKSAEHEAALHWQLRIRGWIWLGSVMCMWFYVVLNMRVYGRHLWEDWDAMFPSALLRKAVAALLVFVFAAQVFSNTHRVMGFHPWYSWYADFCREGLVHVTTCAQAFKSQAITATETVSDSILARSRDAASLGRHVFSTGSAFLQQTAEVVRSDGLLQTLVDLYLNWHHQQRVAEADLILAMQEGRQPLMLGNKTSPTPANSTVAGATASSHTIEILAGGSSGSSSFASRDRRRNQVNSKAGVLPRPRAAASGHGDL